MSVVLSLKDITKEQRLLIAKMLVLQPKTPPQYPGKKNPYAMLAPKKPIHFFLLQQKMLEGCQIPDPLDKDKQAELAEIRLPHKFASALTKQFANNMRFPLAPLNFSGNLFEHQVPVEEEAWNHLCKYATTTLGLYPGFGKTILGAKLASRLGLITCILVTREFLTKQWAKTFQDFTDAKTWIVGERAPAVANVIICMDTRVDKLPEAYRKKIGLLIIDEAHMFCTPHHVKTLLAFEPRYVIAETATLDREDGMHLMIQLICGNHIIKQEMKKPFNVYKILTQCVPEKKANKQGRTDWAALTRSIMQNEERNNLILRLVITNLHMKILILTSQVEHTKLLCAMIQEQNVTCDFMASTKKTYNDSRVLVGTLSKISTGFDEATACPDFEGERINLVILVCSIKKHGLLEQSVGRGFRSANPNVMVLVDDCTIIKAHWYKMRSWFISRGGTIHQ
jgi:superfamily II DNA or RNA helicase